MPRWPSALVSCCTISLCLATLNVPASSQVANQFVAPSHTTVLSAGWIGTYQPDGKFKDDSKHICSTTSDMMAHRRLPEVPGWLDLQGSEAVVHNMAPPHRLAKPARPASRATSWLSAMARLAYGRDAILIDPTHLVVDSKNRLIVVDPQIPAVHVLSAQEESFRIMAGTDRRIQQPVGVAVDRYDKIYVADRASGVIQVFDRTGIFLRTIGLVHGEPIFAEPTTIAIAGNAGRLFVLDPPVNELVVLDLEGNVIRRIGGPRHVADVALDQPTAIALHGSSLAVLDQLGTRVHIFDLEGNLAHVFETGQIPRYPRPRPIALALDSVGNVYVGSGPGIQVYNPAGRFLGSITNCGHNAPAMWINDANRAYISDPALSRVNVLQLAVKGD